VASRLAIDALTAAFGRQPTGVGLAEAVSSANAVVWAQSQENADLRGMGTTLTAVALVDEGGHDVLALVNVGDSRSYRFHDGELTQITKDHSLAEEMVLSGELTPAEAAFHPHRHILTRALGVSPDVDVDVWRIRPIRGERFLLCSDGLTNELGNNQIIEVLSTVADPQAAADLLVRAARTHGGSDNITAVVIDVIVGDEDTGSVPAVAPMSPDFIDPNGPASDGVATPQPMAVPEINIPNRRDRRRAKRRERRRDRGRRLITFRTLLFIILFVAIVGAGYYSVRWYNTNSYYVGVNHNELVIYQGRIGGFLWYKPVEVQRTGVTTADVLETYLPEIRSGVAESTLAKAQNYVKNVRKPANTTTVLPPAATTTTTTTTTVPGTP
jgi:protein phosphatase